MRYFYSITSLQRTPMGPGPSVHWGGVRPFAGVHSTTLECSYACTAAFDPRATTCPALTAKL